MRKATYSFSVLVFTYYTKCMRNASAKIFFGTPRQMREKTGYGSTIFSSVIDHANRLLVKLGGGYISQVTY